MDTAKVLWTGGFDSTFMVLKYLRRGVNVKPYYIDWGGPHHTHEINAIHNHFNSISKLDLEGKLEPLSIYYFPHEAFNLDWYDPALVEARRYLFVDCLHTPKLGMANHRAYEHLRFASLPKSFDGISIGIPADNNGNSGVRHLFDTIGHIKSDAFGVGYFLEEDCHPAIFKIYGRFKYPVAFDTEPEMLLKYEEWGYTEIIRNTRFCKFHDKFYDGPCGTCFPCQIKFGYGMYEFFTLPAWKRANTLHELSKKYRHTDKTKVFPCFKKFCDGKFSGKNYTISEIAELFDVPMDLCVEFEEILNKSIPTKEEFSRLGKYC